MILNPKKDFVSASLILTYLIAFAAEIAAGPPHFDPVDLKKMLESNDSMPDVKPASFLERGSVWRPVFRWQSKNKSVGHYPGYANSPKLTLFGLKVWEAYTRFSDGSLNSLEISLYNRGDAGAMSNDRFRPLLKTAKTKIDEWMAVKPSELPRKKLPKNRGIIRRLAWVKGKLITILQWSSKKLRGSKTLHPEYLKCVIRKFDPANDPRKVIKSHKAVKNKSLKSNVKTNDDGDTYIDGVPMVDQGQKGYCAVAATERIMRYFGSDFDEHDIAQLAGTSEKGTNPVEMLKMLKRAGTKLRTKLKVLLKPLDGRSVFKEISKINKYFRRKGASKIGEIRSFDEFYQCLKNEFDAYKDYKCVKNKSAYKKFRSNIVKYVDAGIPVQWGVQLGLVEEEKGNPQAWGGHMRLIIGYNKKTDEIVFTDTWGPDHEFKKMKWDDAWAITTFYAVMTPR